MANVTLKDFKVGEPAFILHENRGRLKGPEIYETTVKSVGRKYVTIADHWESQYMEWQAEYLIENKSYGKASMLFPSREAAGNFVKLNELALWFNDLSYERAKRYGLDKLASAKAILEV